MPKAPTKTPILSFKATLVALGGNDVAAELDGGDEHERGLTGGEIEGRS